MNTRIWGILNGGASLRSVPPYRFQKTIFSHLNGKVVEALRQARLDAGLTQVEAAKRLGCRQTFLSKIECGERRIDIVEFVILCDAYGADAGRLLKSLLAKKSAPSTRRPRK